MKTAKDFAQAWGVKNPKTVQFRLNGKTEGGKYKLEPAGRLGPVAYYTDEDFERITGVKVEKVDTSEMLTCYDVAAKYGITAKAAQNRLRTSGAKPAHEDSVFKYYLKEDVESLWGSTKPVPLKSERKVEEPAKPKQEELDVEKLNLFTIFSHRVLVLKDGRWTVVRFGLRDGDCLKLVQDLIAEGNDVLIRSY